MSENLNNLFSWLFRQRWLPFALVAFFIFVTYGVWIFSTPKYEVMYNHRMLPEIQTDKVNMHCHIIEIGNTGRMVQQSVDVAFYTNAFAATAMKPKASDFGISDRKTEIRKSGDTTTVCLGSVKPGKRIEIQLLFIYKKNETPFRWDEIFKGVEIARGKAKEGDPGWTTVGRMLFAVFG